MRPWVCFVAGVLLGWSPFSNCEAEDLRTWTDSTGKYSIEAEFHEFKDSKVHLRRADGTVIAIPASKLSREDQQFVRDLLRQRNAAAAGEAAATTATSANTGTDWPQWRGPNRDAISQETGLLDTWTDGGPPLLWQAKGLGDGFSSVSIAAGQIYTLGRRDGRTQLVCLNVADGSPVWSVPFGGGDRPNCTPTVDTDANLVFGLSHGGDLACVNTSGEPQWQLNFGKDFGGKMMSGWGYSESPLVDGDYLVCTPGAPEAILAALDKKTGQVVWKTPARNLGQRGQEGAAYSSIVISRAAGVKQYVQLVGRGVIGVEAKTGRPLWSYDQVANTTANVPTPIVKGDYVFCSSGYGDGGSALLQLSGSGGNVKVREVYYKRSNELQNHHGGMVLLGDYLYFGHGHNNGFPVCVEMLTGRTVWAPGRGPGSGSAAIVCADGHLYFRYQDHTMALIEATPEGYHLKGTFKIATRNGESWPHPVVADGKLYLRDQDELSCYDLRKP